MDNHSNSGQFFVLAVLFGLPFLTTLYIFARRSTFIGVGGALLILFAPLAAEFVAPTSTQFNVWLTTFRLLGVCVFVWGLVENIIAAIRPPRDESK